jgi:hypothetical protein
MYTFIIPGVATYGAQLEGDVDLTTVFLNGYYELPIVDAFSIYFMAGIGYAKYDVNVRLGLYNTAGTYLGHTDWVGASDNVFAYKAGTGVTWNFTDQIAADLGYEYLGVADTDIADSINSHNVVLSVRFKFYFHHTLEQKNPWPGSPARDFFFMCHFHGHPPDGVRHLAVASEAGNPHDPDLPCTGSIVART